MLTPLLFGCLTLLLNMTIQVAAVVVMLRVLVRWAGMGRIRDDFFGDAGVLMFVLLVLFAGHLAQIAVWALLFVRVGEFDRYATAYYHSTVNFATLGYGDIVMSERWRLLGALQAASGILMFGLSTSTLFMVMLQLFRKRIGAEQGRRAADDR